MFRNKALALTLALVFVLSIGSAALAETSTVDFEVADAIAISVGNFNAGYVTPGATGDDTDTISIENRDASSVTVYAEETATWVTAWNLQGTTATGSVTGSDIAVGISGADFIEQDPIGVGSAAAVDLGALTIGNYDATVTVGVGPDCGAGTGQILLTFAAIE